MRVGVIRGDMPGPVLLSDLEPVSRYNPPTEPRGQEIYISRPTTTAIEAVLANSTTGAGAVLNGSDISGSLPLTIDGTNDTLLLKTSSAATFTTVTIAHASYSTFATLIAAIEAGVTAAGLDILARANVAGNGIALESTIYGVDSYIENDTVANGSIGNTDLGLADGAVRTMVSAATLITDTLPVGGPLDVSTATINGSGTGTASSALSLIPSSRGTTTAVADAIAPRFWESTTAIDSFLVGDMAELLNANFNPDTRRLPPLVSGPAITVVEDDGSTLFGVAHTLPIITTADLDTPGAGDLTITGTGLGSDEREETTVHLFNATTGYSKTLLQKFIEAGGGSVSDTAVFIPAALIPGATVTTTTAQVRVRQRVSGTSALV
jgi:hypothetical protein